MFNINGRKDREIITNAFKSSKTIFSPDLTTLIFETHIVIGTSLYIDHFHILFNQSFWNRMLLLQRHKLDIRKAHFDKRHSFLNQLTILNGWKKDFATKNQVRQDYFDSEKKYRDGGSINYNNPIYTSSVNDDFEKMTSHIFKPDKFFSKRERHSWNKIQKLSETVSAERNSSHERVKTFLYKMLNDDEIDKQQSNEFQFMRSDCDRLTVSLQ